jgi:hypothetical protein
MVNDQEEDHEELGWMMYIIGWVQLNTQKSREWLKIGKNGDG